MGLKTSHDAWTGSYGLFNAWREALAAAAGLPPLFLMEGFCDPRKAMFLDRDRDAFLPIRWESLKDDPIIVLLNHSDCDGVIAHADCLPLAERLRGLLDKLSADNSGGIMSWRETAEEFISGLMIAHEAGEDIEFH